MHLVVVVQDRQEGQLTQLLVVHDRQEGQLTQLLVLHNCGPEDNY